MELSHKALQGSTPVPQIQYPTLAMLLHLLKHHLTPAKMKIINISFVSFQLPRKCLDKDLIIENAESCLYWKNKTGKNIDCKHAWGKKSFCEFSTCSSNQIDQTAILCDCFLTF